MQRNVSLREITDQNRAEVMALSVLPNQERFIGGSPAEALADADKFPEANPWPRAIYAGDEPVGILMLSWNVEPDPPNIIGPWYLWKMAVDSRHQGCGYGQQAMGIVVDVLRREGVSELLTSYVEGEGGPAGFYASLGFVPTGERDADDEVIVALAL